MRLRAFLIVLPLCLGLAADLALADPAAAGGIECGSVLGPGGTYVLDHDLVCGPQTDPSAAMLYVLGGATLNLKGHTVQCLSSASTGIWVSGYVFKVASSTPVQASLKKGTVKGCGTGVRVSNGVVKRVLFDGNATGVLVINNSEDSEENLLIDNAAINGDVGFSVAGYSVQGDRQGGNNTLINNIARNNRRAGFMISRAIDKHHDVLIGNTAIHNGRWGFFVAGPELWDAVSWNGSLRMIGNVAKKNRIGFEVGMVEDFSGNVAKRNAGIGFILGGALADVRAVSSPAFLKTVHDNVADGNGGDGFQIAIDSQYEAYVPVSIRDNYAIGNGGIGMHVVRGYHFRGEAGTISGSLSIGNRGGDVADDEGCTWTTWQDNTFNSSLSPCIR